MIDYFYTALIDVLGYRDRLSQDITTGSYKFKDDLEKALSVFDGVNSAKFSISAISDTIILTCNSHQDFPEFLTILRSVFISFLRQSLLIRGGVAYSKHFHSGKIMYSHAVARAYEIESKLSIYPRIVVDNNIVEMYKSGRNLPHIAGKGFFLQQNGITFLNILEKSNWEECYDLASKLYYEQQNLLLKNEGAFLKHSWFENYLFESEFKIENKAKYIERIINY